MRLQNCLDEYQFELKNLPVVEEIRKNGMFKFYKVFIILLCLSINMFKILQVKQEVFYTVIELTVHPILFI